jgi:circadian clock protein KaiC
VIERISTGNARLDAVLGGGLLANSITLIAGAPGSGKTILAERCLFENATAEQPGLYLSTVSEPLDKLLRYGQSLTFFDVGAIGKSVFYEDLGEPLAERGLAGVLERIDDFVRRHRPGLVVIDSFKALRAFAANASDFHRFLRDLCGRLTVLAISAIWVGEYDGVLDESPPEFAVADAIVELTTKQITERPVRVVRVRKLRGSEYLSGDHVYRLTEHGLEVFPRLASQADGSEHGWLGERVPTGVPALDDSFADGYWPGSTTLVAGPSGIGKTVMGLNFLFAGSERGEPGILVTFQKGPTQLARIVERLGWSMGDPNITVIERSPVDVCVDEVVYELLECVEVVGARRIVIDELGELAVGATDPARFREFIDALAQRCAGLGVSLMLTYETAELFGLTRLRAVGVSHFADNVVLLQYVQRGAELLRAITIVKSRGSSSATRICQFHITAKGVVLGEPIDPRAPPLQPPR